MGLFDWDKYKIVDSKNEIKAYVIANSLELPRFLLMADPTILIPQIIIGKADSRLIDNILNNRKEINYSLINDCRFNTDATSQNIITEIKGINSEKMMVVGGHYDTQYNCPVAIDNGSGVAGLLKIIEYFKNKKPPYTIRFIFFGAEEYLFLGVKAYMNNLIDNGKLKK